MVRNSRLRNVPIRLADREGSAGYTLLELLVVLAILVFIAGLAVPQVIGYLDRAKVDTARTEVQNIGAALDLFRLDVGRYPSEGEGLASLVERPTGVEKWAGPYVKSQSVLRDPWDQPYRYVSPGEHGDYDLYSLGADGAEGGDGADQDIASW